MIEWSLWGWFVLAGLLLNLTPGPDVLCIVSQSLRSGVRAGIVAGLGICAGCLVHVFAAALGLSALLLASATAFNGLKWLGAAYLLWVGVTMLRQRSFPQMAGLAPSEGRVGASDRQIFWRGFLTNVLNPKVILFFLAFVPQFIAPDVPHKAMLFVWLGLSFTLNSALVNVGWALLAAQLARGAAGVRRNLAWLDKLAGLMFVGFGLKLALLDNPNR